MEVKPLPIKVRCDSLSAHTEINHQSEAGNRAQPESNQIGTLALKGRYYGEFNMKHLKKCLIGKRESDKSLDFTIYKPAALLVVSCITKGWW